MGVWGTDLYSNDTAFDIKETYLNFLQSEENIILAYQKTVDSCIEILQSDEKLIFWLVIADVQWDLGILTSDIKSKAFSAIETLDNLIKEQIISQEWKMLVGDLKNKLSSTMPFKKKVNREKEFLSNPWKTGDLYAYCFNSENSKIYGLYKKYIVFQKIADEEWCDNFIFSRVQVYDKVFDELPNINDIVGVRILPIDDPNRFPPKGKNNFWPLNMNSVMICNKKSDFPEKSFSYIGNKQDDFNMPKYYKAYSEYAWKDMESQWLCEYYSLWQAYDYEICDRSECVYLK